MKNSLDIQTWRNKYIYQITESENDEWDLGDLDDDYWNVKELTVGDTITPDMWRNPNNGWFSNKWIKIQNIQYSSNGGFIVDMYDLKEKFKSTWYMVEINNDYLKPQYQIVPPSLNEQDENEWDLGDLGDEWNTEDLDVGSIITPNMWVDGIEDSQAEGEFDKPHKIVKIWNGDIGSEKWFMLGLDNNTSVHSSWLKPVFHLFKNHDLTEQDNEWDLGNLDDKYWNNYEYEGKLKLKIKAYLTWNDYEEGDNLTQEEVWIGESIITPSDLNGFVYNYKPLETAGKTLTPDLVELWLDEIGFNPINWVMEGDFDIEIINTDPGFEEKMDVIDSDWDMEVEILGEE